jgi:hypothetical protein
MSGGVIGDNSAMMMGGGVFVEYGGTFTMSGGEIRGNSAGLGGGVFVVGYGGTFTMSGGVIGDNSAMMMGGGVYVDPGGTFTMSGGEIRGNSADRYGGGVYMEDGRDGVRFAKTGESVIYGYDNAGDNADLNNTCDERGEGNAVCVVNVNYGNVVAKRDSTAGEKIDLYWPLDSRPANAPNNWE